MLKRLLEKITGHKRDNVRLNMKWNDQLIIPNLFRVWEKIAGRKHGIRIEHSIDCWTDEDGVYKQKYHLYSWESKLSYVERTVRVYSIWVANNLTNTIKYWNWKVDRLIPQFGEVFNAFRPQFVYEGFVIEPTTETRPEGYVFTEYALIPIDQGGSSTPTVDIGSGSNRIVYATTQGANGSDSVTAISWNSESMTKQGSVQTGSNRFQSIFSLIPTGTGSHAAAITGTLDINSFIVYTGVAQTSQPHNYTSNAGTATNYTLTVTTAGATDWIFGCVVNGVAANVATGTTKFRSGGSNSANLGIDSNGVIGATTIGANWTSNGIYSMSGVSMSPYSTTTYIDSTTSAASGRPATTLTYAHTCNGSNVGLFVGLNWTNANFASPGTITSVTYNGNAMAELVDYSASANMYVSIWWIYIGTGDNTAHDIVITVGSGPYNSLVSGAVSIAGVSSTQNGGTGTNTTTGANASISVTTTTNNSLLFSSILFNDTVSAIAAVGNGNTTTRWNINSEAATGNSGFGATATTTTAGSNSITITNNSVLWKGAAVEVIPYVVPAGPANLKSFDTNLKANIKSIDTNLIANIKSLDTNV